MVYGGSIKSFHLRLHCCTLHVSSRHILFRVVHILQHALQHNATHCIALNKILQQHSTLIVSHEVHVLQHALLCTAPHYITGNNILQQPSTSRPDTPFVAVRVVVRVAVRVAVRDKQWVSSVVAVSYWVCCSVLQCVAVCCSALRCLTMHCSVLQCIAVRVAVYVRPTIAEGVTQNLEIISTTSPANHNFLDEMYGQYQ